MYIDVWKLIFGTVHPDFGTAMSFQVGFFTWGDEEMGLQPMTSSLWQNQFFGPGRPVIPLLFLGGTFGKTPRLVFQCKRIPPKRDPIPPKLRTATGSQVFRDSMLRRIFFPGENVLSKESAQKDLVLLARGAVSIEIAGVGGHGNWCWTRHEDEQQNNKTSSLFWGGSTSEVIETPFSRWISGTL